MSRPLDRDICPEDLSPYAPKWARDAADARSGRRQVAGLKATENPNDDTPRSGADSTTVNEPVLVDAYRIPPSLEPTLIPQPPPVPRTRYILGILVQVSVAACIAAVIALSMLAVFPTTWLIAGRTQNDKLVALTARYSIPTIYDLREFVDAGGLVSYGASLSESYRRVDEYVGRVRSLMICQ
jgi:hypothetical protein